MELSIADGDMFLDWLDVRAECARTLSRMYAKEGRSPAQTRRILREAGYWSREIRMALCEVHGPSAAQVLRMTGTTKRTMNKRA